MTSTATSTSSVRTRKNALGARSDPGWKHGIEIPDTGKGKHVKCKYCEKEFFGGVYRLKNHLGCTRKDVEPCPNVPENVKEEFRKIMDEKAAALRKKTAANEFEDEGELGVESVYSHKRGRSSGIGAYFSQEGEGSGGSGTQTHKQQSTMNQFLKKELRMDACRELARLFHTSAIPFNVVNNPYFESSCNLITRHGPGFKPLSFHEIRDTFLKEEVKEVNVLVSEHRADWRKYGCSIMSDGWTNKCRRSIINFMVNSPRGTVFIKSIDASDITKDALAIVEMLDGFINEVGEENVVQVITDNAANYVKTGEILMQKRPHLFWSPCQAHYIDLVLEDFEKKIPIHKDTIAKGRKITTYIYGRTILISMMKTFTNGRELIRPGITRFATAYLTLGCLNDLDRLSYLCG